MLQSRCIEVITDTGWIGRLIRELTQVRHDSECLLYMEAHVIVSECPIITDVLVPVNSQIIDAVCFETRCQANSAARWIKHSVSESLYYSRGTDSRITSSDNKHIQVGGGRFGHV
jgi:hypothetical protein